VENEPTEQTDEIAQKRSSTPAPEATTSNWLERASISLTIIAVVVSLGVWIINYVLSERVEKGSRTLAGLETILDFRKYTIAQQEQAEKLGSIEFRMGDVARGKRLAASPWS
jgi:hypothetical protein